MFQLIFSFHCRKKIGLTLRHAQQLNPDNHKIKTIFICTARITLLPDGDAA